MCRLCRPSSCAICFQTASSYPSVVSMRRRTSDEGDLASMNLRTASRSCSCSSENAKFIVSPSGSRLTREPEHALLHEAREHPHAVVLHDLDADVRVGEPLANRLVGGRAVLVRDVDEIG